MAHLLREETSMPQTSASPLHDPAVHAVIERARRGRGAFPVAPEQGDLMYLMCRATGATRVAEFATSLGVSTLYLTAAVRDNGGGIVIGSEIVAAKAEQARANLASLACLCPSRAARSYRSASLDDFAARGVLPAPVRTSPPITTCYALHGDNKLKLPKAS
jgi:hypothetical protein